MDANSEKHNVDDRILYTAWYSRRPGRAIFTNIRDSEFWLASNFAIATSFKHAAKTAMKYLPNERRKQHINQILDSLFRDLSPSRQLEFYEDIKTIANKEFLFMVLAKIARSVDKSDGVTMQRKLREWCDLMNAKMLFKSDHNYTTGMPLPPLDLFAAIVEPAEGEKFSHLMRGRNADTPPSDLSTDQLTTLLYSHLSVWLDLNKRGIYIQEWLMLIFEALHARIRDQYRLWYHINSNWGVNFSLITLTSLLESSISCSPENLDEDATVRDELYKRIITEAVCRACTDSAFDYQTLLQNESPFDLSLVDVANVIEIFDIIDFEKKGAPDAEQVLAIFKHVFHSWNPSTRLDFVMGCDSDNSISWSRLLINSLSTEQQAEFSATLAWRPMALLPSPEVQIEPSFTAQQALPSPKPSKSLKRKLSELCR